MYNAFYKNLRSLEMQILTLKGSHIYRKETHQYNRPQRGRTCIMLCFSYMYGPKPFGIEAYGKKGQYHSIQVSSIISQILTIILILRFFVQCQSFSFDLCGLWQRRNGNIFLVI